MGQYRYGSNNLPALDVVPNASRITCTMTTTVRTIHMRFGTSTTTPYAYPCFESNSDFVNGGYSVVNDAHYIGGIIYAMYQNWYKVPPIKSILTMREHYSRNYENAFWNGVNMTFGDGYRTFYPLVSLDVAGHEVSHGFTEQNSNLQYRNQSGGINESFSDMAGKAVEFYATGRNTWSVGESIYKATGALRYMDQPTKDGRSIDNATKYITGMDPHYSSGVFNKAFYFLATSPGYDTHKAFDLMVNANQHYWQATSTFQSAAQGVVNSARDLAYDTAPVIAAFAKVGITVN
jgi:vibriolysin